MGRVRVVAALSAVFFATAVFAGGASAEEQSRRLPERAREREPLSAEQKTRVREILSRYDARSLTPESARAIHGALRDAGIPGGPAENEAVREADFDPERLRALDPPPARPGAGGDPGQGKGGSPPRGGGGEPQKGGGYSVEQAISDRAQLNTVAFSGLAFLTGDFGSSTFLPPGKVADFFGFQYMRDVDAAGKGHNPLFLDRIAGNVLSLLSDVQRADLERAARDQEALFREVALKRFPLIAAFHRQLAPDAPGLDPKAVEAHCAELFALDARLAWQRARVFGALAASLTEAQKNALARLKFADFGSWRPVDREVVRKLLPRGASKLVAVGVMTLASEFFSWTAGSVEADTYFCPERHGTYFGGFYMKDMPAMGQKDFEISTSLTGDAGEAFLATLTPTQRTPLTRAVESQRGTLREIVEMRRAISVRLREILRGGSPAETDVVALGRSYGRLDGVLAYQYATAFAAIGRSLTPAQREKLTALRPYQGGEQGRAFLYSDRIPALGPPEIGFLMTQRKSAGK